MVKLMHKNLLEYIAAARAKNLTDEQIKNQLLDSGWPLNSVNSAFSVQDLPLETLHPPVVAHTGMWIGFLYILFFISLYVLTGAIAGVFHSWINTTAPNLTLFDNTYLSYIQLDSATVMRGYLASILISYPIFVILGFVLKKNVTKNPKVLSIRSRKILIYITLIGTFLIILWNIISAIFGFLSGSLMVNVLGNLCVTILIAGGVFSYFFREVRDDGKTF